MRNFHTWLTTFRDNISDYSYYVDFKKVYANVEKIKIELNILNSLIGSKSIQNDFKNLVVKYPEILKCIPILLAVRLHEVYAIDTEGEFKYNFKNPNYSIDQYCVFMQKTGLFELLGQNIINNLVDYVTGVETGLDSNGRKNRGGKNMENLLESYIQKAGFLKGSTYFKEIEIATLENKFNVDLSAISNNGETVKRFDFAIYNNKTVYGIETNFYTSGGSKLNEVARSYKNIAMESKNIQIFEFVWITDGKGWHTAKKNLMETFGAMEHLYNIQDLENGILQNVTRL